LGLANLASVLVEERLRFYESIGLPRTSLVEYWQSGGTGALRARHRGLLYNSPSASATIRRIDGKELEGIAARGDFDLSHINASQASR